MKKEDFWVFSMGWVAANTPLLVELLHALLPVLAIGVVGYALHLIAKHKGGKND